MAREHPPTKLDKVWIGARLSLGRQPNGYILKAVKDTGEFIDIIVRHYENDKHPPETVSYPWEEFEGNYTNETQGWVIEEFV